MADLTEQQLLSQDPEVLGLQRQRQLANLLTGQAFNAPQGQMISGHYVKPSGLQQALPMINAAIGGLTNANLDTKQTELAAALRGKEMQAAQQYATATTPQARMAAAMSPYAPQMIKTAFAERMKPQKVGEGETIYSEDFGTGQFAPMVQGVQKIAPEVKQAMQFLGINKPLDQLSPQELNAIENKAITFKKAGALNFNMPPAETAYSKTFGEKYANRDIALEDAASNAQNSIDNITRQRSILKSDKAITGFGAEPRLALAQFGQAIGAGGKDSNELVSNTQALLASRASATLDAIKTSNLGSAQGFSNTDREFLEKAKLGGIKYTSQSLNHQLDIEEKLARVSVDKWNNRLKQIPKSAAVPLNANPVTITPPSNVIDYNSWK